MARSRRGEWMLRIYRVAAVFLFVLPLAAQSNATSSSATIPTNPPPQNPNLDQTLDAGESESDPPVRRLVKWNEYDGKHFTLRVGGGFLYEYAAYAQDDA